MGESGAFSSSSPKGAIEAEGHVGQGINVGPEVPTPRPNNGAIHQKAYQDDVFGS